MKRPSQEVLDLIGSGTIMDFLIANNITALAFLASPFFHTTGYGYI